MSPREIGELLRRAGLTQPALLAWAGTHRISALPRILPALARRPIVPASTALALFVAGAGIPTSRMPPALLDAVVAQGLVVIANETVHANLAIVPLEQTLLVCDRYVVRDASGIDRRELVCWPDDSSYHLASAISSGRRERWIDLATGSAFAPLARPALASQIVGVDLNPRAVAHARLGAALSGCDHFEARCADIGDFDERAPLVTCNAPILDDPDPAMWRSTDQRFFDRMWRAARTCVAPRGEVIVHCVLDGVPDHLDGDVVIVVYTPPGERAYAVTRWRPDAAAGRTVRHRELTAARPHVDERDLAPST